MEQIIYLNSIVLRQIYKAHNMAQAISGELWNIADYIRFFDFYYGAYEEYRGERHPNVRTQTFVNAMLKLPSIELDYETITMAWPEYKEVVYQYFETPFEDYCNYSIAHFAAGDIIKFRYLELS